MIADKAIAQVSEIISDCGFAVEVIHQDYGEDLLVQTKVGDEVDPSKIWIQVKGTENLSKHLTKKHGHSLRISEEHASKWVRSPELVIVVIWDVNNKMGLWSVPAFSLSEWDFRMSSKSHTRLCFADDSVFDSTSMTYLAWLSRCRHYEGLLAQLRVTGEIAALHGKSDNQSSALLICFDFLILLGVIVDDGLDRVFYRNVNNGMKNLRSECNEDTDGSLLDKAIILSLLSHTKELAGFGLPPMVLFTCSSVLAEIVTKYLDTDTGEFFVKK